MAKWHIITSPNGVTARELPGALFDEIAARDADVHAAAQGTREERDTARARYQDATRKLDQALSDDRARYGCPENHVDRADCDSMVIDGVPHPDLLRGATIVRADGTIAVASAGGTAVDVLRRAAHDRTAH